MKQILTGVSFAALALAAPLSPAKAVAASSGNLQITWIDVEGGAAQLIVAPAGESLVFDTGYEVGDRDAKRIFAATQKAGLNHIDHLVISHWHGDHVGGAAALAKMIPIAKFYDHGDGVEQVDKARHDAFVTLAAGKRTILKSGDTIQLGAAQVQVVKSEDTLAQPVAGGGQPNPLCADAAQMGPAAPENQRMVGLRLTFGNFKYMSLADLDWQKEMELACPVNKLGTVNLYLINRHGGLDDSGSPALLGAIKPQVIIVNNGPRKGLGQSDDRAKPISAPGTFAPYERNSYLRLAKLPGIEGIWQEHLSLTDKDPAHNTAPDMIANLEEGPADQGYPITATVAADGKFTITNTRNGFSKTYTSR
jgi:competence protein ComEC